MCAMNSSMYHMRTTCTWVMHHMVSMHTLVRVMFPSRTTSMQTVMHHVVAMHAFVRVMLTAMRSGHFSPSSTREMFPATCSSLFSTRSTRKRPSTSVPNHLQTQFLDNLVHCLYNSSSNFNLCLFYRVRPEPTTN